MYQSLTPDDITIIGAVKPQHKCSIDQIIHTLQTEEKALKHGEEFTGRPTTRIYSNDSYVIKFKSEHKFVPVEATRWIKETLEKERAYNIYHPSKTWFIINLDEGAIIANITEKLSPLHTLTEEFASETLYNYLKKLLAGYFKIANKFEKRLDEGLSNFALDTHNRVFYIDDDIYEWDDFTALSSALGVLLLKLPTLTAVHWHGLGAYIRDLIITYFNDSHWITVVVEQLKGTFLANEQQQEYQAQLFKGLLNYVEEPEIEIKEALPTEEPIKKTTTPQDFGETIVLLADIHSNYPALDAVLGKLKELGINQGLILGDIVGYGPHPQACIERLMETDYIAIKGNHDNAIATGSTARGFSNTATWVVDWSREQLNNDHLKWLENLPPYLQHNDWLAVHGAPKDKTFFNAYVYRMTYEDNLNNLEERQIRTCFHGHSHIPTVYYRELNGDHQTTDSPLDLSEKKASLICPGSVGKTRSNVVRAEFALFNTKTQILEFHYLDYDVNQTIKDMEQFGFPEQLVERLLTGQ